MDLEEAYREYHDSLERSITAFCRDEQAAMDAVSHAFSQALTQRMKLEQMPSGALRAWLHTTARNAVIDQKRKERRYAPPPELDIPDDDSMDLADYVTDNIVIQASMATLTPALREVVFLRYFQGMNATEIGEILGVQPATVRTRIRAAIRQMRMHMEGV